MAVVAVFDTVIFVRSLINPHGKWGRLVFSYASYYRLVVSEPILTETLAMLQRPELTRKFRTLPGLDRGRIMDLLAQAESVEVLHIPSVSRDPEDNKLLATAQAASADYLVAEDQDLLVLKEYQGVRIVTAAEFIRLWEEAH